MSEGCWCGAPTGLLQDYANTAELRVMQCAACATVQLHPDDRLGLDFYASTEYRESVDEQATPADFARHDWRQRARLYWMDQDWRDKRVLDIGAGGGGFLAHIGMLVSAMRAIEPCTAYHPYLATIGANVYSTMEDLTSGEFDVIVSHSTIEHLAEPAAVLTLARERMAHGAQLWLTTPACSDRYRAYRRHHSWYFTASTLTGLLEATGFALRYIVTHREDPRYNGEPQLYACARADR